MNRSAADSWSGSDMLGVELVAIAAHALAPVDAAAAKRQLLQEALERATSLIDGCDAGAIALASQVVSALDSRTATELWAALGLLLSAYRTDDPDRLGASKLQVTVTVTSADMSSAEVNEAIRAPEWFDFARFAEAEFRSSEIRRTAQGLYVARGKLTLKGITQEMAVPFSWTASGNTAALEGETTLKRSAFGIGTGEWENGDVIGLDVKVKYKIKLRKAS